MSFEMTWENCKNCPYCNTENGQSDWTCEATNDQFKEEDYLPCNQTAE